MTLQEYPAKSYSYPTDHVSTPLDSPLTLSGELMWDQLIIDF